MLKNILHLSIVLVVYLLTLAFFTSDHKWLLFVMQTLVFVLTIVYTYFNKTIYLFRGMLVFLGFIVLGMFVEKSISLGGVYLFALPLVFYLTKKALRHKVLVPLVLLLIVVQSFIVMPNYREWIVGFNYPNSIGKPIENLKFVDKNSKYIDLPKKGIVILDFWSTSCGVCYKKFPILNDICKDNKDRKDIFFYAVNMPEKGDKSLLERAKKIETFGYDFETIYALDSKIIEKYLDFNLYPRVIVVKDGRVVETKLTVNDSWIFVNNLRYYLY